MYVLNNFDGWNFNKGLNIFLFWALLLVLSFYTLFSVCIHLISNCLVLAQLPSALDICLDVWGFKLNI